MQKIKKRKVAKIKFNFFNAFMLSSGCLGLFVLGYDFIRWAIIPFISGEFICMTYFGMFIDLFAIGLVEIAYQCLEEY